MITGYRVTCWGKEVGTYRTIDEALVVARKRCPPGHASIQPVDAKDEYSRSFAGRIDAFNTALRELRDAILRAFGMIP